MKTRLVVLPAAAGAAWFRRPTPVHFAPKDDTAAGVGIAVSVHRSDADSLGVTIALSIPEAADRLDDVLLQAKALNARVVLVCDTAKQATDIAKLVAAALPEHRRISIDKAKKAGWGLG